ncbi:hypothetical protein [Mycolicibacterium lacusdiani]|uniref:hypothetical protein n=1 Tax=Mycolicibacterium lacusdiani TaxID=2895283 RepID=UPI001F2922C7|nr:hypothetical protein [Mycolicibacterium lacusdiani]
MNEQDITAQSIAVTLKRSARIAAALPDEVQLIRDITIERLKSGPKTETADLWAHLGEHMREVIPGVLNDPRLAGLGDKLEAENKKIEETGPEHFSPAKVAGTAAGAIAILAIAVGAYCTTGPYPAKGESLPAHCT